VSLLGKNRPKTLTKTPAGLESYILLLINL
jgi:hypothetical protein